MSSVIFISQVEERELKQVTISILRDQCKEIEENNRMGRLEISSRKLETQREHFMQRWAQ